MPKAAKSAAPKTPRKKKAKTITPRGLTAREVTSTAPPTGIRQLAEKITADGGEVLASYRDPLGAHWQLFAALPIELVEPTPYQRDLSETHVAKLGVAIDKLDRFLDPVIATRTLEGKYWTPNGNHRLAAMRNLGARSIVVLIVPEHDIAHRMLVLNTEKAHNVKERALAVVRLATGLADLDDSNETDFEMEFEEPRLLTLGFCYQQNGRFSGSVYSSVIKPVEAFLKKPLPAAIEIRRHRADQLLELDAQVADVVARLKARGFESPYIKNFVLARINHLRFVRGDKGEFDEAIAKMLAAAKRFDTNKVKADQVAASGGASEPE
ncbi:MAG TPA: ParB N-terminal domain-containing protein [Gemmatimonadales bacterium]|nr:ParB N-terminal domain-containing protein [Gemmatimonadales bacterium]